MKRTSHFTILPLAATISLLLAVTGCNRDSVKVYHVETNDLVAPATPPAQASAPAPGATMPSMMPPGLSAPDNSGLPALKYTLPDGWKEKTLTQMRVASFAAGPDDKPADVSVVPMGGQAGGDLANVNRWRGQVGLPPFGDEDLQKLVEKVEVAGQPANLYDLAGTAPDTGAAERILAAISFRDDTTWFFKMTGDATLVEAQKPAFIAFLKSVQFGAPAASAPMDMSQLPPAHPPMDGTAPAAALPPAGDKPVWDIPAGWQEGPLAQFLVAKYIINGAGGEAAEVNISSLDGDGGGVGPNVNRWRGQLGLPPATDDDLAKLPTVDATGTKGTIVEFSGTNARTGKSAQLIGVILPLAGETWFYKLMGDAAVVSQQKDAFLKFIQSAKYPDAR